MINTGKKKGLGEKLGGRHEARKRASEQTV